MSLRSLLEILTPRLGDKNKSRWYKTKWWENFLAYDETIDFSLAERDVSTKILLGSANGDTQRMAFGEVATVGDVEDFRGFYTCDGLTTQPMKFYVCDLYFHGFNELGAFKRAYEMGSA